MNKLLSLAVSFIFFSIIYLQWRRQYFEKIPRFFRFIRPRPYVLILLFFMAGTLLIFFADRPLLTAIQNISSPFLNELIRAGGWLGQGTHLWLILLAGYYISWMLQRPLARGNAFGGLLSMALASLLSTALKPIFLRARPYGNLGPLSFFNPDGLLHHKSVFQSFPSGDTAIVAAAAFYLWRQLPKLRLKPLLWVVPCLTALSRVSLNRHWPSDTFFSLGLGLLAAELIFNYESSERKTAD